MSDTKKGPKGPTLPDVSVDEMPEPNAIKPSGSMASVKVGDFIAYVSNKGGTESCSGGWFPCPKEQTVSPEIPQVGIALNSFVCDSQLGARMHSVSYKAYRRYYQDPNKPQLVAEISQADELAEILQ